MSIHIRNITTADTLQLRRDVMYPTWPLERVTLPHDADGLHYGLYSGGRLVTVVSLFIEDDTAQFRKLATAQDQQGRGFGKLMMKHLLDVCRERGITTLWCNARESALDFYRQLGFTAFSERFFKDDLPFLKMKIPVQPAQAKGFTIIPAIDIIGGKCVRLTQGDYAQQKVYNENPLEVAVEFEDAGIQRLHLVDLDGAKKGTVVNWKVLEAIAGKTALAIDFGGGIKSGDDLKIVFESGAALATIGSVAVKQPELFFSWLDQYGAEKMFLGADVKDEKIAVGGWLETTDKSIFDFLRVNLERGVKEVFCTDIAKDGLLQGPSTELYKKIIAELPGIRLTASGGVSHIGDVEALQEAGLAGVIIGKAIYEGRITLQELKKFF
ncbi:1-(5-phosphoribosyl)-5-[(5-phosphoribosylamino)methylideneamino]imidazole-4-carboxamide isomerase [Chitinophaga sp. GCM10012297]|uniref:1-(5-phosphoribosyl)-5-[(5-phosphoribosylamino)methylideneamino] imidazole-4-carboxamide isomerase n=1 Tax=Chitinophaga chungangae TaxID=2821488 RepID=A0ABS3Y8L5_9BACT|nr:1-(5-phosphoribosyl)-5-[(5-phosphoribosylamino)methylideneamino]imidazole-4-carboxamide isomerase [Chitinophaga chungangae]MBO9151023.1 1-(5-phosphoribosyl)-5-[(5-phosphoribosylamino)methylideneamino]imidazole-4-carboxamide isomerase [Chitinophaga chungangae]